MCKYAFMKLCVAGIIKNKNNEILFLKRSASGYWVPPCGGVEKNEKILDALHREIYEEAGIKVKVGEIIEVWQGVHEDEPVFSVSYLCEALNDKVTLSDEHVEYKWVPVEQLQKVNTDFNVQNWLKYL